MITILVVSGPAEIAGAFARHASVEVLHARDAEDALEKLARNRRIDAVLLLGAAESAARAAAAIFEEDPAPPPLYAPESSGAIPKVHPIGGADPVVLIEDLAARLQPGS